MERKRTHRVPASRHLSIIFRLCRWSGIVTRIIWVGTDSRGLLRFNAQGVAFLHENDSEAVTALFEDREGNLWIGSASGLERLRDSAFVTYSLPEGLPTDGSNPVFVDAQNRMWFPPVDGGLMVDEGRQARTSPRCRIGQRRGLLDRRQRRRTLARQTAGRADSTSSGGRFVQRQNLYPSQWPRTGQRLFGL